MKSILTLLLISGISIHVNAQVQLSAKDSVNQFYDSLLLLLKSDYLLKKEIDWSKIEHETKKNIQNYVDFKSSLSEATFLFDKIKGTHCQLYYQDTAIFASYNGPTENDFSTQWINKYVTAPSFEVKVLDKKYGYILMPSLFFEDISSENIHAIAQPMYDQITKLKSKNKLKGWVIDLRFNNGGNVYPMLLALYDLLGDNPVWGMLDIDKKQTTKIELAKGVYLENDSTISYITPKGKLMDKMKVAIITNIATGSSGEITAMSFKGRKNTLFIGEPSGGATTTNDNKILPFGCVMALTVGYDCDRNGQFYDKIVPTTNVSKEDNFDNLMLDKNIIEAIKFFQSKK